MSCKTANEACVCIKVACIAYALACGQVWAQAQRDPTQAPFQSPATPSETASQGQLDALPTGAHNLSSLVRDGTTYLVFETRLYGVGHTFNGFLIERITETEVWLRRGKQLQKIQRFTGIARKAAQP